MEKDELLEIQEYLSNVCRMAFEEKWKMRSWRYDGATFKADVPKNIQQLLDEALKYENDLGEYCYEIKKDLIVVFVYEKEKLDEPACYFIINVKNMQLETVQDHDNNILIDDNHNKMADEYCHAIGIERSSLNGWMDIPYIK